MKKLIILSAACGVGKSTIKDALNKSNLLENYVCIDTDEVGVNWYSSNLDLLYREQNQFKIKIKKRKDSYGKFI